MAKAKFTLNEDALRALIEPEVQRVGAEVLREATDAVNAVAVGKPYEEALSLLLQETELRRITLPSKEVPRLAQVLAGGDKIELRPAP